MSIWGEAYGSGAVSRSDPEQSEGERAVGPKGRVVGRVLSDDLQLISFVLQGLNEDFERAPDVQVAGGLSAEVYIRSLLGHLYGKRRRELPGGVGRVHRGALADKSFVVVGPDGVIYRKGLTGVNSPSGGVPEYYPVSAGLVVGVGHAVAVDAHIVPEHDRDVPFVRVLDHKIRLVAAAAQEKDSRH